jgi:4-alpha-glucanotransferase
MKICFQVSYPTVWGQFLRVAGSIPALGEWDARVAPAMRNEADGGWTLEVDWPGKETTIEYKFCLVSPAMPWKPEESICWETGENRVFRVGEAESEFTVKASDVEFQEENPPWRGAGVAIPVFALRSRKSFGIGDFSDLLLLVDWVKLTGQKVIQILPINDTTLSRTWRDSYPYNAISGYALHPLYLRPEAMGRLRDPKRRAFYRLQQRRLNALPMLDYEAVDRLKWAYFRELFEEIGEETLASPPFAAFLEENSEWLTPYSEYCCRRDQLELPDFYAFIQFHAHRQMLEVRDHARRQGVILKGDVPIGINREGVEAQTEPEYFNLNVQAGAPPDAFSAEGQVWGFPTYDWPAMEADDYRWWRRRFRKMADYFDAYRIDHILGFFRIWQIPVGESTGLGGRFYPALPLLAAEIEGAGLPLDRVRDLFLEDSDSAQGYHPRIAAQARPAYRQLSDAERLAFDRLQEDYFYRRNSQFWEQQALKHLTPLVNTTEMLPCGEDLGMIPPSVPDVMRRLRILSLEIERMPKLPGREFTDLQAIPYRSVCSTSTHDMPSLRGWWREDRERTQRYYNQVLGINGTAPEDCTPEICRRILDRHLLSAAMLVIIPLQDWLALDEALRAPDPDSERINIPAHSRHYWRYRMPLLLENLLAANTFNASLRDLIRNASRSN